MSIAGDWVEAPVVAATQASGNLADMPAAAGDGSFYYAADQGALYLYAGGVWTRVSEPAGRISATLGASARAGCILLTGQAWPATTGVYADLYALLGGTNLPDFQGYALVGKKGSGAFNLALGAAVGEETHALTTSELAAHNHTLTGVPALTGAPALTGTPGHSGAPALTGAPALSGAPSLSGSPSVSDPGHNHTATTSARDVINPGNVTVSGNDFGFTTGSVTVASHTTGITVGAGTLAVGVGSLSVGVGTLAAGVGTLANTIGTLAATIGTLAATLGTMAVANTGSGTAHNNCQPSRVVNWEAKL